MTVILNDQLKPNYDSPLEWWYMHGDIKLEDEKEYDFVLTIFRNQFKTEDRTKREGYQFIISISGTRSDESWQKTLIDPVFFNEILNNQAVAEKSRLDRNPLANYFSIVKEDGPPHPVILSSIKPEVAKDPFSFKWENLSYNAAETSISFRFTDEKQGLDFSFECSGIKGTGMLNLYRAKPGGKDKYGMNYLVNPRLNLQGKLNQKRIIDGRAWIDHQWGEYEWLYDRKGDGRIKGWTWLGINLDNGSDLMIWQRLDAETEKAADCFVALISSGELKTFEKVEISSGKKWFSYKTDCWLPVELEIHIPGMHANLFFKPSKDDQEITVFGPMRTVWQGAGEIYGEINGISAKGKGRLELSGHSYIHNLENHLSGLAKRVNGAIEEFLPKKLKEKNITAYIGDPYWNHEPVVIEEMISNPVWDLINRSGKRWRPILSYLLMKALGIDPRPYEQAAFALAELLHTGSLIIDDIQDKSLIRRGEESIHHRYGLDLAITAGNTLYFLPALLIIDHPVLSQDQKRDIISLMNRQLIQAHFGQSMDLYWSRQYSMNGFDIRTDKNILDRYLQMYSLKTGSPIQGLAETAAIIAGSPDELRSECGNFARKLGIAFQTIDDTNNFSNSGKWGKFTGEDLKEGKVTYAIAYCIQNMNKSDSEFITELIRSEKERAIDENIRRAVEMIRESGHLGNCRKFAKDIVENAWDDFAGNLDPSDSKIMIKAIADYLTGDSNYF